MKLSRQVQMVASALPVLLIILVNCLVNSTIASKTNTTSATNQTNLRPSPAGLANHSRPETGAFEIKRLNGARRQGRARSLSEDTEDHRQPTADGEPTESPEQRPAVVSKEGVAQMRRAARNAQRKMELVSGRLDQIQSLIAEDHKPATSNYSDGGNSATGSGMENANYEPIVSSTPNGGLVTNNIESPNLDHWAASSGSSSVSGPEEAGESMSAEQQQQLSARLSSNNSSPADHIEWITPMNQIKSVIPARQEEALTQTRRDSGDDPSSSSDQSDSQADVSGEQFSPKAAKRLDSSEDELKPSSGDNQYSAQYNTGSRANNTEQTGSSMLGVEYNPNQNYQYFSDLNAENHRQAANNRQTGPGPKSIQSNSGAVAFRSFNPPPAGPNRHKSQNMTVINSETDLMNSFSSQQQQRSVHPTTTTTTSTTRTPTRKSAVYSYSSSNYGKSSKEQQARAAVAGPVAAAASETYEVSEYPAADNGRYFQENRPIQWPALAASYQSNKHQQEQSIPITVNDGIQASYEDKNRPGKGSERYLVAQSTPMMTQESGHSETIQPKVGNTEPEGGNSNADSTPQSSLFGSQSAYQQQVGGISRQLNLQEADNSQSLYNNNNFQMPQATASDEMAQESNSEPIPERQNNGNNLEAASSSSRQQQLSRMAAAIVANNPSFSNLDINSLVQNYQQQQRLLAAQLAQQQQQSRAIQQQQQQFALPIDRSSYSNFYTRPSISRAFYATEGKEPHSVNKRYSPEVLAAYQIRSPAATGDQFQYQPMASSENSLSGTTASELIQLSNPGSDSTSYATSNLQYQPYYSSYDSNKALASYYRALQAAAVASANSRASYDNSQYQTSGLGLNNYSTGSGSLYATAAMNSPAVYEAPGQQAKQQSESSYGFLQSGLDSNGAGGSGQQYPSSGASTSSSSGGYKRSYLNSLFKPSASSRYYYTPTILSPISLAGPSNALHSLYAPTIAAASAETMPGIYATGNPYGAFLAPASQHDQAAQYHALAAAANSLQPQYMEPDMAESSLVASDSQATGSSSSSSNDNEGSSSKSGGKGMGPWTNIAGLLLGILPFGILMASLLPAVTLAGRKKRELELVGGRNFSELLKWRAPSRVLDALVKSQRSDGVSFANATAVINEQLASLSSGFKQQTTGRKDRFNRQRSLLGGGGGGLLSGIRPLNQSIARSNPSNLIYNILPDSSNFTNSPADSQTGNAPGQVNGTLSSVKSKVKKAFSALNHFITAAQNIKRKHRSSIIDTQWNLPGMLRNLLKLDNLFNIEEFKRQLASVAHTRAILAQQRQLLESNGFNLATRAKPEVKKEPPRVENVAQSSTSKPVALMATNVTQNSDDLSANYATRAQVASPPPIEKDLEVAEGNIDQNLNTTLSVEYTATQDSLGEPVEDKQQTVSVKEAPESIDNTTRKHLEVCLNQFLCRLTVKLNKSMRGAMIGTEKGKFAGNGAPAQPNPDQLEKITKSYINQLVEQIEAQNPSVLLSLTQPAALNSNSSSSTNASGLDALYKNAIKNQCATMYNCVELDQLEKTLSRMKLKFS